MSISRFIPAFACLLLGSVLPARAISFSLSYEFEDSTAVAVSFEGTENGGLISDVQNIALTINGQPVLGPVFSFAWDGAWWANGPISVTNDPADSAFLFSNVDYANGGYSDAETSFWVLGSNLFFDTARIDVFPDGPFTFATPIDPTRWIFTRGTAPVGVPEGGSTLVLLTGLTGLLWFFRRRAVR